MGLRWAQKNLSPIAVDFGADSIKLLQVLQEEPPRLVAAAERDIPTEARKDADGYYGFIGSALKQMSREAGVRGRRVIASISAATMYVQHVRLPSGDPELIQQQLEVELRGRLPLDPVNMVVRHVDVGQVFADGASKHEVICFAASRESVMRSVKTIRQAGLDVVGMHSEPMAIVAAFGHLFRRAGDEKRTTFFIDIGGATTKALIAHGRDLVFAKTINVAGEHFSRQMAQVWDVDVAEARHRRIQQATAARQQAAEQAETPPPPQADTERRHGAPLPGMAALNAAVSAADDATTVQADAPSADGTQPASASATAAAPQSDGGGEGEMLEALIDELQLCAGYHGSMFPDRPIEKVVFLGGESRHAGMCQRIARALRLPAQLADPMARVSKPAGARAAGMELGERQPGWAVPVGLCALPTNL